MDTRQEAAIEIPDTRKVDEAAIASEESDNQVKRATSSKPRKQKVAKRPKRASGKTSGQEKLVCRYCGSDDLSPSFKKRRDARCRACFANRYSGKLGKKTKRAKKA
jgi:hypothetical protein